MNELMVRPEPERMGLSDIPQGEFDNEWIKFMAQLAKNESLKDIVGFIRDVHWSRRQRKAITYYSRIILGRGLATTNFLNERDYRMLYDDKDLIMCDLTVGMTRFDLTPEFNILIGMINLHFGIEARRSKGGWFTKRIGAQRHEIVQEERQRDHNIGYKEKIQSAFGMGEQ